ncbi:thioredoxin domain-containing protein [Diaminobutyricibacter tongyongensis]|uniref:thioredoxin domain-containing protein n=1 Tax=Leifsonia tongyongensis TaxID=1268043 RepID=UPI003083F12E
MSGLRGAGPQFAPIFEQSAYDNPDIVHGKLDTEADYRVATAAGITAIPTLMAFRDGVLVLNQAGALPATALAEVIEKVRNVDIEQIRKHAAEHTDQMATQN